MWLRLLLPLAALGVASVGGGQNPRLEDLPPALTGQDLRVERFALFSARSGARGQVSTEVAGFVEWRRRQGESGPQLECDTRFFVGPLQADGKRAVQRVVHIECLTEHGPKVVWREIGPGSGRSIQAEWSSDGGALDITEWSPAGKRRGTLIASGGASMPLYLAELLRHGRLTAGNVVAFDPLARTLEPLEVRTVWLDGSSALDEVPAPAGPDVEGAVSHSLRTVELLRADGTVNARYRFSGLALLGFQWQDGPLCARAVSEDEFERLVARYVEPVDDAAGARSR